MAPVADHGAGIGQERVVGMHHALRRTRGAGGEREVADLVRVGVHGRRIDGGLAASRWQRRLVVPVFREAVEPLHLRQALDGGKDVEALAIGAVAGLREQGCTARAFEQRHHVGAGVVLVQRRVAHIAVARAGKHDDCAFDPVGQPDGHPVAAAHARAVQVGRQQVDLGQQRAPREAGAAVAQRKAIRPLQRVLRQQRIERVVAPVAGCVVRARSGWIVQGQQRRHEAFLQ